MYATNTVAAYVSYIQTSDRLVFIFMFYLFASAGWMGGKSEPRWQSILHQPQ